LKTEKQKQQDKEKEEIKRRRKNDIGELKRKGWGNVAISSYLAIDPKEFPPEPKLTKESTPKKKKLKLSIKWLTKRSLLVQFNNINI
jgi:hypothetical protein